MAADSAPSHFKVLIIGAGINQINPHHAATVADKHKAR